MRLSGIQKTTLLDYPQKIACIIFTAGCNMRCKYCYNSEFVLPEKLKLMNDFIPEEVFFNYLKTKISLLDGVVICGGEPTLHPDLEVFCKKIKDMGFLVKLDTNGSRPDRVKNLIDKKLIDYVAMDIKGDFDVFSDLIGVNLKKANFDATIDLLINSGIDYEFRTTIIKNYHNEENFKKMVSQIRGAKIYYLQNYKKGNVLDENFSGDTFSKNELANFKDIAINYVEKCKLRI